MRSGRAAERAARGESRPRPAAHQPGAAVFLPGEPAADARPVAAPKGAGREPGAAAGRAAPAERRTGAAALRSRGRGAVPPPGRAGGGTAETLGNRGCRRAGAGAGPVLRAGQGQRPAGDRAGAARRRLAGRGGQRALPHGRCFAGGLPLVPGRGAGCRGCAPRTRCKRANFSVNLCATADVWGRCRWLVAGSWQGVPRPRSGSSRAVGGSNFLLVFPPVSDRKHEEKEERSGACTVRAHLGAGCGTRGRLRAGGFCRWR